MTDGSRDDHGGGRLQRPTSILIEGRAAARNCSLRLLLTVEIGSPDVVTEQLILGALHDIYAVARSAAFHKGLYPPSQSPDCFAICL